MFCSLSTLSETSLKEINQLETEISFPLLAFSSHDVKSAILPDDALKKVQDLEEKLGISLLAVDA